MAAIMIEIGYVLLKRDPHWRPIVIEDVSNDERPGEPRIRCPLCAWEPRRFDLWTCWDCPVPEGLARGCGTSWHTFATGGRCPGCTHQWVWTTCLACEGWSRHLDWYADE
jgi:hypothetical protein